MFRKLIIGLSLVIGIQTTAHSQSETQVKSLTLSEVIEVAHEQSLMALMSRHQFRSSYWEFRSYQASTIPGYAVESEHPPYRRKGICKLTNTEK